MRVSLALALWEAAASRGLVPYLTALVARSRVAALGAYLWLAWLAAHFALAIRKGR